MRVLVVGAGAVGGYFGARLAQAGRDVTFLVRPARRARLQATGLVVKSTNGDFSITPKLVESSQLSEPFDLVILSCKAYDLDNAMESVAPAVGPQTVILPLLNGMRHLERLTARFGEDKVLGGYCNIGVTMDAEGAVVEFNKLCLLAFGERTGGFSDRVQAIAALMEPAQFTARASDDIVQEMWEKWLLLSTLAGSTCLMRAAICDIVAAGGRDVILSLLREVQSVATSQGHGARPAEYEKIASRLTDPQSLMTASMMRDAEGRGRVEADHVLGDLLDRAENGADLPLLRLAYLNLKSYEHRLDRERK